MSQGEIPLAQAREALSFLIWSTLAKNPRNGGIEIADEALGNGTSVEVSMGDGVCEHYIRSLVGRVAEPVEKSIDRAARAKQFA